MYNKLMIFLFQTFLMYTKK